MQDWSPQVLDDLIAQRQVNHSTVAIQELMHTVRTRYAGLVFVRVTKPGGG
jgi:hypothetical protein